MNHYFITGATGNIGSALIPLLLKRPGIIQLLIRADDEAHLQQRFAELCSFWGITPESARERILPCRGDMTEPGFGLNTAEYDTLSRRCTHIIHCGGVVRMNLPIEEARKSAVGAAREIIALAEKARRNGTLKKIDFVSTVGVIGCLNRPLTEQLVTEERRFHNTYEQAKAEAEDLLYPYMANNNLPMTIHRPSMVVGDSQSGKVISFQVFYHICEFVSGKRTFGLLPRLSGAQLDIIPVDYVARVIAWASDNPSTCGQFIHECAGDNQGLPIVELERRLENHAYFSYRKIHISLQLFNATITALCRVLPGKSARVLRTLPHFLNYLDDSQDFHDQKTIAMTKEADINKPTVADYIETVISFYIRNQKKG